MTEQQFKQIYPPEVIELMLIRQQEQGNPKSIELFLENIRQDRKYGGFKWGDTVEKHDFWEKVLVHKNFDLFYSKYPKKNEKIILLF